LILGNPSGSVFWSGTSNTLSVLSVAVGAFIVLTDFMVQVSFSGVASILCCNRGCRS
jgi:hypothetical protein